MRYLFGPVPSRRLGISLGVDLVPFKYCSMNCIYCEIGKTTVLTTERKEYIPYDGIVEELDNYLIKKPKLDFITFSGAGEPTLNSRIGDIITLLKSKYSQYKIALITNSSLFDDEQIRKEINAVDLILPSLDAVSEDIFMKINRADKRVNPKEIIEGLRRFKLESKAEMWLEIFLVPGINDTEAEISKLKEAATLINPDRVQLNSLDRPGTEDWVIKEQADKLEQILEFFKPLPVEIIAKYSNTKSVFPISDINTVDLIVSCLKRRPLTAQDIALINNLHINEVNKFLRELTHQGLVKSENINGNHFYRID